MKTAKQILIVEDEIITANGYSKKVEKAGI